MRKEEPTKLLGGGLLRLKDVLRVIPVSASNWWAGIKTGRYPAPVKLSERVTCWKSDDIRRLIEQQCQHPVKSLPRATLNFSKTCEEIISVDIVCNNLDEEAALQGRLSKILEAFKAAEQAEAR